MQVLHSHTPSGRESLRRPRAHRLVLSASSSTTGPSSPAILIPERPRSAEVVWSSSKVLAGRFRDSAHESFDSPFAFQLAKSNSACCRVELPLCSGCERHRHWIRIWLSPGSNTPKRARSNQRRRVPGLDGGLGISSQRARDFLAGAWPAGVRLGLKYRAPACAVQVRSRHESGGRWSDPASSPVMDADLLSFGGADSTATEISYLRVSAPIPVVRRPLPFSCQDDPWWRCTASPHLRTSFK